MDLNDPEVSPHQSLENLLFEREKRMQRLSQVFRRAIACMEAMESVFVDNDSEWL